VGTIALAARTGHDEHAHLNDVASFTRMFARGAWPRSLVGAIAEAIACAIIDGRLLPGDELNSVELSKQLRTSRAPIREALLLLEKESLVEIVTHRRPRVKPIRLAQVRNLYQLRAALYSLVAELVVANASNDEIASLAENFKDLEKAAQDDDLDGYFWANVAFRNREVSICGNPDLEHILHSLGLRTLQMRHLSIAFPGRLTEALAEYRILLRAYSERDSLTASALNRSAVMRAFERLMTRAREFAQGENGQIALAGIARR
jgi:DNA-binding GntR family transcriptional regulator